MRQFLPAVLFSVGAAAIGLQGIIATPARGAVAVAFPPFTSEATAWAIVRDAGGSLVGPTRLPNVVVAFAPDAQFQERARALGAWFFVNAPGLCAPITETRT